jgi:hypothetical protein
MIEFAQANLMTLIAGAVITSSLLGFASYQEASADALAVAASLDRVAVAIAAVGCGAARPFTSIDLAAPFSGMPASIVSVELWPTHLRATDEGGASYTSLRFAALPLDGPLDLTARVRLEFAFEPFALGCSVSAR